MNIISEILTPILGAEPTYIIKNMTRIELILEFQDIGPPEANLGETHMFYFYMNHGLTAEELISAIHDSIFDLDFWHNFDGIAEQIVDYMNEVNIEVIGTDAYVEIDRVHSLDQSTGEFEVYYTLYNIYVSESQWFQCH